MKHEKCYLCLRTRVTLVPGPYTLLQGGNGMPLGVQLVAPRGDDARLLRTARWFVEFLGR